MSVSKSNELSNLYDHQKLITDEFINELEYMRSNDEITYDVYSRLFDIIDRFELWFGGLIMIIKYSVHDNDFYDLMMFLEYNILKKT